MGCGHRPKCTIADGISCTIADVHTNQCCVPRSHECCGLTLSCWVRPSAICVCGCRCTLLVLNGYIFEIMLCELCAWVNSIECYKSRGLGVLSAHKLPSMQCVLVVLRWHGRWHVRPCERAEPLQMNYENSNIATERVAKISHTCDTHTQNTHASHLFFKPFEPNSQCLPSTHSNC